MASFNGPMFQMTDGSQVHTKVIYVPSTPDISPYLSQLKEDSILKGNRAIIFEVYWHVETKKSGWLLSTVRLSTRNLCLLLRLGSPFPDNIKNLYRFFASKSLTFVGVQIEEDLTLLKENHGLVIRNAVEIGKLAAKAHGNLVLEYLGTRELAHKVLLSDMSRLDLIDAKWEEVGGEEHLEAATTEGWLIFNAWKQLAE